MINAPTNCFFTIQAYGEAAQELASAISPAVGADIQVAMVVSEDISSDIQASHQLASALTKLGIPSVKLTESYNPLYVSNDLTDIDQVLNLDFNAVQLGTASYPTPRTNPFVFKVVEVQEEVEKGDRLVGTVQYYPFQVPSYTELVSHKQHLN